MTLDPSTHTLLALPANSYQGDMYSCSMKSFTKSKFHNWAATSPPFVLESVKSQFLKEIEDCQAKKKPIKKLSMAECYFRNQRSIDQDAFEHNLSLESEASGAEGAP